jgi:bifunctional non-homologous end joining protein LigD
VSRNGHTFKHWPHLCEELAHAVKAHHAVMDGEIVCLDARGRSNFKSLLFRRESSYFYAFDLLALDGEDLREWPLVERKRRLRRLIPSVPTRLLYVARRCDAIAATRPRGHRDRAGKGEWEAAW